MIIKLKCVDNGGCDYLTKGKIYEGLPTEVNSRYFVNDDDDMQCLVSTSPHWHGKWEVVN